MLNIFFVNCHSRLRSGSGTNPGGNLLQTFDHHFPVSWIPAIRVGMTHSRTSRPKGFSLIELMITLVISSIVLLAILTIFSAILNHSKDTIRAAKLRYTLQSSMDLIAKDIMRAGYWANAHNDIGTENNTNPFMADGTDIQISSDHHCLLLTYDADKNGSLAAIDPNGNDEHYGYRLLNNAIQARPYGASFDCNASSGAWENMTNAGDVMITDLSFVANYKTVTISGSHNLILRNIVVTIAGYSTAMPSVASTITKQIQVRNDKFVP